MSEAYERERQNNARLDELSAKVSALRGVTIDIYDNARAQDVIDSTVSAYSAPLSLSLSLPQVSLCSSEIDIHHTIVVQETNSRVLLPLL